MNILTRRLADFFHTSTCVMIINPSLVVLDNCIVTQSKDCYNTSTCTCMKEVSLLVGPGELCEHNYYGIIG